MAGQSCKHVEENEQLKFIKENLRQIIDLQNFHNERLLKAEEEVNQLKKHIKNYEILRARITTLPDKLRHDVMVPFGSLAFMPGQIIHTNEILTLLGDNWFAELSAKQAISVISRRIQVCKEKLKEAESICHIHRGWVDQSKNIIQNEADDVEITETVSEEEYIKQKEDHILNVRKQRTESIPVKFADKNSTDEDILERLNQLIMQEAESEELDEMSEDALDSDDSEMNEEATTETERRNVLSFKREKLQRRVSWADKITDTEMDDEQCVMETPEIVPQVTEEAPIEEPVSVPVEEIESVASIPIEPCPVQRSNSLSRGEKPKGILKKSMSQPVPPQDADALKVTFVQNLPDDEDEPATSTKAPLSESPKEMRSLKNAAVTYKITVNE